MAAAVVLSVALPTDDGVRLSGGEGSVDVDLRIVVITDDGAERMNSGARYAVGQSLVFRLGATPASPVSVWADGPEGRTVLGTYERGPVPTDLTADGSLLSFTLDVPGMWTVFASADGEGSCPADSCASRAVEVVQSLR